MTPLATPEARAAVLISATELGNQLASSRPPVLLDVRWALGDPHGRVHYDAGHLPGAVFVDLDDELAAHSADPRAGRHPLPELADLQDSARRWGISDGDPVVVYDNTGALAAARAWWLLRWAHVTDVRILDGGLAAWVAAGGEVVARTPTVKAGNVTLQAGGLPVLDADGAAQLARDGLLLDARAAERYRGEVEPMDPRAGHIPGAVSAPTGDNLDSAGQFRPTEDLAARFGDLGAVQSDQVGVYCGSGVTAAHQIAALAVAGVPAALYAGSWSAWSNDPDRAAASGPDPG